MAAQVITDKIKKYRRALLLQGPRGTFFSRFGGYLRKQGIKVYKINFNGGDEIFYPAPKAYAFRGRPSEWEDFIVNFLKEKNIDAVFLFGDCRPCHQTAIKVANQLGIAVFVFEEGYIRPDYITLEKYGVNGHSQIPCNPKAYLHLSEPKVKNPRPASSSFFRRAGSAVLYHFFELLMRWRYPHYQYHKQFSYLKEPFLWVRSGLRKIIYRIKEKETGIELADKLKKKYFLVPLQVADDSQIVFHSKYKNVEQFIAAVIKSFAGFAANDFFLVIKHHPMDRGHKEYSAFINRVAKKYGVHERIIYIHDLHLPTLLKNALGTIVINSTLGLSSLHHGTPLKVMGTAIYDLPGLTFQKDLADFWRNPGKVNKNLHKRFRGYIIEHTQLNGSYYGVFPFNLKTAVTEFREKLSYDNIQRSIEKRQREVSPDGGSEAVFIGKGK